MCVFVCKGVGTQRSLTACRNQLSPSTTWLPGMRITHFDLLSHSASLPLCLRQKLIQLDWLASQLRESSCFSLPGIRVTDTSHVPGFSSGFEFRSSRLNGKRFTAWAIFPSPLFIYRFLKSHYFIPLCCLCLQSLCCRWSFIPRPRTHHFISTFNNSPSPPLEWLHRQTHPSLPPPSLCSPLLTLCWPILLQPCSFPLYPVLEVLSPTSVSNTTQPSRSGSNGVPS